MRAATAAGRRQLSTVPSGAISRIGAATPSLFGMSGSKMLFTAMCT
jgi:hypothetical protein